jgi:hypothetical protein
VEVLIQLPITDFRGLVTPDAGRRKRPTWPTGAIGIEPGTGEFVSRFGQLRKPHPTMVDGWAGRSQCVSAKRALRLPDRFDQFYNTRLRTQKYYSELLDRCYFGSAVSPRSLAEIRIRIRTLTDGRRHVWPDIDQIITATAEIPVRVPNSPDARPLPEVGARLANFVRINTTPNSFAGNIPSWLVTAGRPIMVFLLHEKVEGGPPTHWVRPDPARNLHYRQVRGIDVWLVQESDIRTSRRIGLQLGRLHTERATYESLARYFARSDAAVGPYILDPVRPEVQTAIRNCAEYLTRTFTYGGDQSLLNDALSVDLVLHAAEWDSLRECFSALPEGLSRMAIPALAGLAGERIQVIMGDNFQNISGTVNNRSKVIESFNAIANSSNPEVEEFLRKVAKEVESLDNEDAADMAEEFIAAVAEKKKPSIIKTLWTSLKELAPVVGGIAGAAKVISSLIGG